MSDTKHTPGPLKASKGHDGDPQRWCVVADGPTQWIIAVIENGQPGDIVETEGATAHLFAAAPELLEVVERFIAQMRLSGVVAIKGGNDPVEHLHALALEALTKAKGQS